MAVRPLLNAGALRGPGDAVINKASQPSYMPHPGLICAKPGNPARLFKQVVLP